MKIVGIDPGLTGALACLDGGVLIDVIDMPVDDKLVNARAVTEFLRHHGAHIAYIEKVHAMPKNGSIAGFSLGQNTGILLGVLGTLGHPYARVLPQAWKAKMGLIGKDKSAGRALCQQLYPDHYNLFRRVKDDGRADAVLIARSGGYDQIAQGAQDA